MRKLIDLFLPKIIQPKGYFVTSKGLVPDYIGRMDKGSLRGAAQTINGSDGKPVIACGSAAGPYYSYSFALKYGQSFGIWLMATSSLGTPKILIQLEQSYTVPAPQGAADTNWVIGDSVADIYTALNDQLAHVKLIAPVPMKLARLKITSIATNATDTTLLAYIFIQELVA